jgi:hypothetical protein
MSRTGARALCERFVPNALVVSSGDEFVNAPRDVTTISFLDDAAIAVLDEAATQLAGDDVPAPEWRKLVASVSLGPVILVSSEPARTALAGLPSRPWLSHVIGDGMLSHPIAKFHLDNVIQAVTTRAAPRLTDWMGADVAGRRVNITHARRRVDRLARMSEYVTSKGASEAATGQLRDVAEELLTNAFYDAPVAAGAVAHPIPRTQDVALPQESACDLAYGYGDAFVFVRVRDPFGSLSRTKLLEAISSSTRGEPAGPTGLGRVFSMASLVAISVVANHSTEVLVGILDRPPAATRPFAFHLMFRDSARRRAWKSADQDTAVSDTSFNTFVSIMLAGDAE